MRSLELKIPPPVVTLVIGIAMWAIREARFVIAVSPLVRIVLTVAIALIGAAFISGGFIALRRAKTTVSPMKPETGTALVTDGVYQLTRNPIYVGLASFLMAWAVYLSSPVAILGPVLFVFYITQFQIKPEERSLRALFGDSFTRYQARVRRWL